MRREELTVGESALRTSELGAGSHQKVVRSVDEVVCASVDHSAFVPPKLAVDRVIFDRSGLQLNRVVRLWAKS